MGSLQKHHAFQLAQRSSQNELGENHASSFADLITTTLRVRRRPSTKDRHERNRSTNNLLPDTLLQDFSRVDRPRRQQQRHRSRSPHLPAQTSLPSRTHPSVVPSIRRRRRPEPHPSRTFRRDGRTEQVCRQSAGRVGDTDHGVSKLLREAKGRGRAFVPACRDADAGR